MKKALIGAAFIAALTSAVFGGYNNGNNDYVSIVELNTVEAIAACESIGWWDNDGNCVKNSSTNEYFCKDDSWHELTDCLK